MRRIGPMDLDGSRAGFDDEEWQIVDDAVRRLEEAWRSTGDHRQEAEDVWDTALRPIRCRVRP